MSNRPVSLGLSKLSPPAANTEPATAPVQPETPAAPLTPEEIKDRAVAVLRTVYDPEIPVDILELGLVYELDVDPAKAVSIRMTLTSPGCPVAGSLVEEVRSKVKAIPGVTEAKVELVWDPPWDMSRMSEAARLQLGLFDY
jgi:FeS assembly SUF system protein